MSTIEINISNKMRLFAKDKDSSELPDGFLKAATKFDQAIDGFFADPQTADVAMVKATFETARQLWRQATGDR